MPRPRHPKQEVEAAIQRAEQLGWTVSVSKGHVWGRMYCPESSRDGCIVSVSSTPRNSQNHARMILRKLQGCTHGQDEQDEN